MGLGTWVQGKPEEIEVLCKTEILLRKDLVAMEWTNHRGSVPRTFVLFSFILVAFCLVVKSKSFKVAPIDTNFRTEETG